MSVADDPGRDRFPTSDGPPPPGGGLIGLLAARGYGAREALASLVALVAMLVFVAPGLRSLVPIGAPGSTLPAWLLGVFAPLADTQLPLALPLACVIIGLIALAWLVILRDAESLPLKPVVWSLAVVYLLLLLAPPLLSTDVFTYLSSGRLQVLHSVNPYLNGPVVRPQDPVFGWTGLLWCDTPTVYGPIFTLLSAALANFSLAVGLWSLKLVGALSAAACASLTWMIAKQIGRPPMTAMLFVALNPVFLIHGIGGGHNDLLMLAGVLFAVWLTVIARPAAGGAALATAVSIKATAGLVLPFVIIGAGRFSDRGARRSAAGFAGGALLIGTVATLIYGFSWLRIPGTISRASARNVQEMSSIPGMLVSYSGLGTIGSAGRVVLAAAALACFVLAIRHALKGGQRWITGAGVVVVTSLALSIQLHPWYIVLSLPFAALSDSRRLRVGVIVLTFIALILMPSVRYLAPVGLDWPYRT